MIANQIYLNEHYKLNKTFQEIAIEKFSCGVESLDFVNNNQAAEIINDFVEEKTHNKIKNFTQPSAINNHTAVMLINAIYFKSNWKYIFKKTLTIVDDFYLNRYETVQTDFMKMQNYFGFGKINELQATALEMMYDDPKYSFIILLPSHRTGLSALETKLNKFDLKQINRFIHKTLVDIQIPKFKAENTMQLNDILKHVCKNSKCNNFLIKFAKL